MLRFLQKKILLGRDLYVSDVSSELSGDTNYISIYRDNILETTFSELNDVKDPRITFEFQFYGEQAEDREAPEMNGLGFAIRKYNRNILNKVLRSIWQVTIFTLAKWQK